jgi:hypothetical protein
MIASVRYPLVSAIATPLTIVSEEKITTHVNDPNICGKFSAETADRFVSLPCVLSRSRCSPYLGVWASRRAGILLAQESIDGITAQVGWVTADTGGRQIGSRVSARMSPSPPPIIL